MVDSVILAAGYGKRARKYSGISSKGLLDVADRPAIYYGYRQLVDSEYIDRVIVVTNRAFQADYENFLDIHQSPKSELLIENISTPDNPLGAVATLEHAIRSSRIESDVLLLASDNVFDFSLDDMIKHYHEVQGNLFALYELPLEEARNHSVVTLDDNLVVRYKEKPDIAFSNYIVTYCMILNQETLQRISPWLKKGGNPDRIGQFLASTLDSIPLLAFHINGRWFDIGSERYYEEADRYFRSTLE